MLTLTPARLYQQIVVEAADAIIFADKTGIIELWNSAAESIFGYSAKKALGNSLDLIIPEKLRQRHWQGYRQAMASGQSTYGKDLLAVPAVRCDGSRISIEFTIALLADEAGKPIGTAALIRDVTARWQKEKELLSRLAELEGKLSRMRDTKRY
ncbi:MAG: PAS domain S-box protein [Deltaproteobacteria bacterium]|nr:PAS domain S-box protein [Deltaproteobacteria bacterium]